MMRTFVLFAIAGLLVVPTAAAGPTFLKREVGFGYELLGETYGACASTDPIGVEPQNCTPIIRIIVSILP